MRSARYRRLWRAQRALRASLFLLFLPALPVHAHELGAIQVTATFRHDGTYQVDVAVDDSHLPSSLQPGRADGGTLFGPIAGMTPALQAKAGPFLQALVERSTIAFDGRRVAPRELAVERPAPPPAGDPFAPARRLTLHLRGPIPPGSRAFTWAVAIPLGSYPLALKNEGDAGPAWRWGEGGTASAPFLLAARVVPPTRGRVALQYLRLGYSHILPKGTDHILFVLGIFLLSLRLRPMLTQVTAFTVAHTITLALTIYGLVSLSPRIVEPAIALSIVYVAVENVLTRELKPSRVALVFGFGLLHGMGFAGVLSQLGLPRSEFLTALLCFNLGVEGGQLTVITAAFLLIGLPFRRKPWYRQRVVIPASCAIALVGLYWSIQRIFF